MVPPPNMASLDSSLAATSAFPLLQADAPPVRVARPETTNIWGTEFARLTMPQVVDLADRVIRAGKPEYMVTANLNYLMLTEQNPRLTEVNVRSIAVLADGHPIVGRSRRTARPLPERVAGADLIVELAALAARRDYRVYFLGAAPGVAQAASRHLQTRFPLLQIAGCYAPPFRQWTAAEHSKMLADIRAAQPDMLWVAFGQPKGEFWIYDHLHDIQVPLSIQLGASFDFLAGSSRRAPRAWQAMGCEWLFRAMSDPLRLGPRYAANICFLFKKLLGDFRGVAANRQQHPQSEL